MNKILVVLGPTATGKTDLALSLAKKFKGELVSCDSRQVYQGLDIGTGKLPNKYDELKTGQNFWEINGVKIWMYDVVDPKIQFTVKNYVDQTTLVVDDITKRGKLPIIVGGTGLYLKALLYHLPNIYIPVNKKLRGELEKLTLEKLQEKSIALSPFKWQSLNDSDKKNKRRLLRSIEIIIMNPYGKTIDKMDVISDKFNIFKVGLTAPRDLLNKRIDLRLISRINQGLIKEAEELYESGLSLSRMKELGLEYGMLAEILEGKIDLEEFRETLSLKIHQYAKRQMVWFKKDKDINWFDITDLGWSLQLEKMVSSWYHSHDDKKNRYFI